MKRLYRIWRAMKMRCGNSTHPTFRYYGKKGITVCAEWHDYIPFHDWAMANGYQDDLTIDRIDSSGNYEPGNCRWITAKENRARAAAKLTKREIAEIKWLRDVGITGRIISDIFGISTRRVYGVAKGK